MFDESYSRSTHKPNQSVTGSVCSGVDLFEVFNCRIGLDMVARTRIDSRKNALNIHGQVYLNLNNIIKENVGSSVLWNGATYSRTRQFF